MADACAKSDIPLIEARLLFRQEPVNGETFVAELENATLTNIAGFQAGKPVLTLMIDRADLEQTIMGLCPGSTQGRGLTTPLTRQEYWLPKISANQARDSLHHLQLTAAGWEILVIWECETKDSDLLDRLKAFVSEAPVMCGHSLSRQ